MEKKKSNEEGGEGCVGLCKGIEKEDMLEKRNKREK